MRKKWRLACVIGVLLGAACGETDNSSDAPSDADLKRQAREALADSGNPSLGNPCEANAWYGDSECDAWCPGGDATDCAGDEPVACALFFSEADGMCDRDDPCGPVQDADCQSRDPGDGDPVTCIERLFPANGKCEPAAGCEYTDPEDCGSDDLICPAIWQVADGKCDEKDPCGPYTDEDCAQGGGTDPGEPSACIEIAYPANGKCEAAPFCEYTDPMDCGRPEANPGDETDVVVCTAIFREKDGRCSGDDVCDPDC